MNCCYFIVVEKLPIAIFLVPDSLCEICFLFFLSANRLLPSTTSRRQKRMMGMTQNEKELIDVESHYPTDRIPMEMKEKSVAENLLDKMSETQ